MATRMLSLLGLSLPKGQMIPADEDNARGYWESRALSALNERLLEHLGGSWYAPPAAVGLPRDLAGFRREAQMAWEREFAGSELWLWKDPRLCLLLPFWRDLVAVPVVHVVVHRHPLHVADSLRRRNGFSLGHALALWERYIRSSLLGCDGLPIHLEAYEALLADPTSWLDRVAAHLQSQGLAPQPVSHQVRDELLPPRSAVSAEEEFSRVATPSQAALQTLLTEMQGASVVVDAAQLPPESPATGELLEQVRRGDALRRRLQAREAHLAEQAHSLQSLREQLAACSHERNRLSAGLDRHDEERRAHASDRLAWLQAQARVERELVQQHERACAAERALEVIQASTSWRLTKPVRAAARLRRGGEDASAGAHPAQRR